MHYIETMLRFPFNQEEDEEEVIEKDKQQDEEEEDVNKEDKHQDEEEDEEELNEDDKQEDEEENEEDASSAPSSTVSYLISFISPMILYTCINFYTRRKQTFLLYALSITLHSLYKFQCLQMKTVQVVHLNLIQYRYSTFSHVKSLAVSLSIHTIIFNDYILKLCKLFTKLFPCGKNNFFQRQKFGSFTLHAHNKSQ